MRLKQPLPLKTSFKYRQYSPTAMFNALKAIKEQKMSTRKAALQYHVPENTLRQRVLQRVHPETISSGPSPVLSQEEEVTIVDHLKFMASVGYGYTRSEVVNIASDYAITIGKRDKDHPFSLKWFRNFIRRWPELNVTKPRSLSLERAKATSEGTVSKYFNELDKILTKYDLHHKPEHIYNVDEKGLQTEHTPPYIVGSKDSSIPAITSPRSVITTVIGCGNALGTQLPPYFVFQGKQMRQELLDDCTPGTNGTVTDSGWSNGDVFIKYLSDHFLRYLQGRDPDQPVLLLYDGHKSHIAVPVINWAKEHNIVLFVLPAHTSHALQPLDIGCFGPYQCIYNSECHKFVRQNPTSKITKYNICSIGCKAYVLALSQNNLQSSFRKAGIYPFDRSAIDSSQFAPSIPFSRPILNSEDHIQSSNHNITQLHNDPVPVQASAQSDMEHCQAFFKQKADCIEEKKDQMQKNRRSIHKITSGKALTEDKTLQSIHAYHKQTPKPRKRKQSMTNENTLSKPSKITKKVNKNVKTNVRENDTPQPSTSGVNIYNNISLDDFEDLSSDGSDEEVCCVCKLFQPKELKGCISVVFTKWAQCDFNQCQHWTHLQFCCPQRVVRLNDQFICPCH